MRHRANSILFNRRTLLGAAGGALGASLLPLLETPLALAQSGSATVPPKRLVLLFNPNGTVPDAFWPTESSETNFELGPILQPLSPFQEQLLLLKGLDLSVVTGDRRGGPHQRGMGALFTGWGLQEGTMLGGDGRLAGWANGRSVDQQVVRRLTPPTLLPSLELGVRATAPEVRSRLIYSGPGTPVPPLNDPREVFERLVSGFRSELGGSQENDQENANARAQRKLVLGSVQQQYATLRSRVSVQDREKLEKHQDFVAGIVRRLDFGINNSPACVEPVLPPALTFDDAEPMPEVMRLQLDMLALALSCDITRVASVQFSSAINAIRFPWLSGKYADSEGHSISHKGPSDAEAQTELIERGRWYSEQVAYFLSRLAEIPEGNGSVLDNTLIVWGNELSQGNNHSLKTIPFVLAGNVDNYFKMGRSLSFEAQSHNRLLTSILQAMDVDTDTFGDPEFSQAGALAGLTT